MKPLRLGWTPMGARVATVARRELRSRSRRRPEPCRSNRVKLPRRRRVKEDPRARDVARDPRRVTQRSRLPPELELACALRVSEACALELAGIDLVEGKATIRRAATETDAGRR